MEPAMRCEAELFGIARVVAGRRSIALDLPPGSTLFAALGELGRAAPALLGRVIRPDLTGLLKGYVFNLNGTSFADGLDVPLSPGDRILLLSNDAGG